MVWKVVNIGNVGTSSKFGSDDTDKINKLFSNVDVDDVTINSDWWFKDGKFNLWNPAGTFYTTLKSGAITANRTLNLPAITGTDTLASLGLAQTFTAAKTFNSSLLKLRNPANTASYIIVPSAITSDINLTLPLLTANDTVATLGNIVNTNHTYTIYIDGTTVKARNNITGAIDYSGDATNDCAPTINSALANIQNITSLSTDAYWGGGINILHGHYICKTTISLDVDDVGRHGASIVGEGWGTLLDFTPSSTLSRGILTQMNKPILRDFRIKGNSNVTTLIEVQGHGSAGTLPRNNSATIEGILLEGPNANADFRTGESFAPVTGQIGIWFNAFVGATNQLMFYHHVNNCKFLSLDYGIRSTGVNATSVFVSGFVSHNCTYFWYLESSAGSSALQNGYIEGSDYSRYGVYVDSTAGASLLMTNVWGELGITPGQECALVKIESGASNGNFFGSSIKNIIADSDDLFYTVKDDNATQYGLYPGNYAIGNVKAFHIDTVNEEYIGDCKHSIQVAAEEPLEVFRDSNTANQYAGIRLGAKDSNGDYQPYGFVLSKIITNTAGAIDGEMSLWVKQAGSSKESLTVTKDGVLKCGGVNRRVIIDETGLTAGRTLTFEDASGKVITNSAVDVTLADGKDFALGSSSGTKIGTATTQKLGFFNATPIQQKSANADTSGATLTQLETEVNELKQLLRDYGLMA